MWSRQSLRTAEVFVLGIVILLGLVQQGTGFGPYWDSWLFYNRAQPWSLWLSSWWDGREVPTIFDLSHYFPDGRRHPPLMEICGGFCNAVFSAWLGELGSCRLVVEFFTTLWLCCAYVYLRARIGRMTALLSILLFLGSPRFVVHGIRFGIDGMIASMYGLSVLAFTRWHWDPNAKLVITCLLVLSFLTKIQGFYLIPLLLIWVAWSSYRIKRERGPTSRLRINDEISATITLSLRALGIAVLLWPALWWRIPQGILEYIDFNINHVKISVLYFGTVYGEGNPPPWHYPWFFSTIALPLSLTIPILVRAARKTALGIDLFLVRWGRPGYLKHAQDARAWSEEEPLLWAGMVLPLFISSLDGVPKFDGVRLLLPAYGPMIILAAIEIMDWWEWIMIRVPRIFWGLVEYAAFAPIGLLIVLPSITLYPLNICYYSPLIGGVSGARQAGFDLDYLGISMNMLNPSLAQVAKPGDVLLVRGANALVYKEGREGWTPIPEGVSAGRMVIEPSLLQVTGTIYAYMGSRYSDETWEDRRILKECAPLAEVSYGGERICSLHRIPQALIRSLLEEQKTREGVAKNEE